MGYWEFLLQKEGDQSWLPLDASQVEILEGRYRIMAHTSLTNQLVIVHISQVRQSGRDQAPSSDRVPPKRRTLRRQAKTNDNGLMVVMPFTRLEVGTWDILCASAAGTSATGTEAGSPELNQTAQPWRYAVQLRVVAQGSIDDDDWFADDGSEGIAVAGAEQRSAAATLLDPQATVAAMDAFQGQLVAGEDRARPYGLGLRQTALLGSEGEVLGLPVTVTVDTTEPLPPLTLVVRLADPQTAETVALTATPLAMATVPADLVLSVTVPAGLSTRLLLGEVGLLAEAEVLAVQGFTVTVDVASLFNAIANQAEANGDLGVVFPGDGPAYGPGDRADETFPSPPADLKTWDIVGGSAPPRQLPILTLPRSSPELPPKIYYPSPHEVAAHQPTLPLVGKPVPPPREPDTAAPAPEPNRGLSLPSLTQPARTDDLGPSPQSVPSPKPRGPEPQLLSHEAMGFKDLKLQDRFWNRLNDLAVSLQQAAQDNRAVDIAVPSSPESIEEDASAPRLIPFAGEVVIYDDEDPSLRGLTSTPAVESVAEAEPIVEIVTPPVPSLVLPEGDLIAGEPVLVMLRVPFHPNRLYLKVWITDPQTRTLVDEPRQLMNLLPNGQGQLEGTLQLTAPLGCLEAWFEAIAVDMVTLQESYKASVSRAITPAGLSSSSLDEFQL